MDHDLIVGQLLERCKWFMENILQAPHLHHVGSASLAIFTQRRQVVREMLQAKITLEAQQLKSQDIAPCCQEARMTYVHIRPVSPQTLLGEGCLPTRTFQCSGGGASRPLDDRHLGVPEVGDFTDDVRCLYASVAAERPHRVANDRLLRCTGVALSSRGAQGIIDRTADDLQRRQPRKTAVRHALAKLIGYIEGNRTRIRGQEPWHRGLAVGAGPVEGVCKYIIQSWFQRTGMLCKPPGFLNVLALRLVRLNGPPEECWASRGLAVQASASPTK